MTPQRKIEILENCKVLLSKEYRRYGGICVAFYNFLEDGEFLPVFINECEYYLGDIFLKHKPEKIREDGLWMGITRENLKTRISIIDKMINELKQLIP